MDIGKCVRIVLLEEGVLNDTTEIARIARLVESRLHFQDSQMVLLDFKCNECGSTNYRVKCSGCGKETSVVQ